MGYPKDHENQVQLEEDEEITQICPKPTKQSVERAQELAKMWDIEWENKQDEFGTVKKPKFPARRKN